MEAIFCQPNEFVMINPPSISELHEEMDSGQLPKFLDFQLNLDKGFSLRVRLDTIQESDPALYLNCPPGVSRNEQNRLNGLLPKGPDCILDAVDLIRENSSDWLKTGPEPVNQKQNKTKGPTIRQWLYLISLSTKSKRDDMVRWAPDFELTGFVMAGKPGLLCLEGTLEDCDSFVAKLKSDSWADVPSHQKKISVVLQENIEDRAFKDFTEITDRFDMGGFRGNRPDLGQLKDFLAQFGLEHCFDIIFK